MIDNTFESFDSKNAQEVLLYIKKWGRTGNMQDQQNRAPTIQELLDLSKQYPTMTYIGYIVKKPRGDYRVSVEGFQANFLTKEEAEELRRKYGTADEFDVQEIANHYLVRAWWD